MKRYLKFLRISVLLLMAPIFITQTYSVNKHPNKNIEHVITKTDQTKCNDDVIEPLTVDCAFSIGSWCICAHHLRENNLRTMASPIDWMQTFSIDGVAHLFETKFEDFFQNTKLIDEKRDNGNRTVYDKKNNVRSIHYMPSKVPFKKAYTDFKQKMKERAENLDKTLSKSKSVLLLNCREYPKKFGKNSTDKELKQFARRFSKVYPNLKKIYLIDIHNDEKEKIRKRVIEKTDKIEIIQYKFNNIDYKKFKPPFGNDKAWNKILKNVKLTSTNSKEA